MELDAKTIKDKIESKTCPPGYWNFKEQIMKDDNALTLIKWQIKASRPTHAKV